ncbi:dockerin type I repeat-containing protein [Ruminococcus albus]
MLSTTQTSEYSVEYKIPASGEGTTPSLALVEMFGGTGGTFTGTPVINTTYYMKTGITHTHNFTYTASDDVITATCDAENCYLTENKVTLTITAPTLTTYGGTGSASATLTGLTDFNSATGKTISEADIKYVGRNDTIYEESTTAPTDAGEYTASITVEEKTATVDFTIAKAYMTPDPVSELNAVYGQTLGDVTLPTANDGSWTWKDALTTLVGNAGIETFKAVFTPSSANYTAVEQDITINVAKADPTPDAVTGLTADYGKTLADVALPNGWAWDAPATSVGNVGDNAFAATYTPDDTANYNTFNQDLTVTVVPVDKTALNDTLTNANNYLDTIKNDADYATPSSDLSTAISTVNAVLTNDNVTEAQVAQAITDVNNAVTTAKSDVKDIDDTKDAQAVTNKINALTAAENVSTADKTDIEAARAAYDDLTVDQKAKVSTDTLEKLTEAETALAAAEKDDANQAAANAVTGTINELPAAEDITTEDKADIEAARKAYNELTEDQKAKVSAEAKAKLEAAEIALAEAEKNVIKGDVNFDGKINVTDVIKVAAHVKGKNLMTKEQQKRADVNHDGKINISDITKIAAHVKGKKLLT